EHLALPHAFVARGAPAAPRSSGLGRRGGFGGRTAELDTLRDRRRLAPRLLRVAPAPDGGQRGLVEDVRRLRARDGGVLHFAAGTDDYLDVDVAFRAARGGGVVRRHLDQRLQLAGPALR